MRNRVLAAALMLGAAGGARASTIASIEQGARDIAAAGEERAGSLGRFFDASRVRAGLGSAPAPVRGSWRAQSVGRAAQREEMLRTLDFIGGAFKAQYGPARWKRSRFGWDIDRVVREAKAEVEKDPAMTVKDYQKVVRRVIESAQDYHVSVQFAATEASTLPLTVLRAGGRYYIGWIDRDKLSEASFPFKPGDEIVSFGGRPTAKVAAEIQAGLGPNTETTNQALAALMLTRRRASSAMDVPEGPVTLSIKRQGQAKTVTHALVWDHAPESVSEPGGRRAGARLLGEPSPRPLAWLTDALSPTAREIDGEAAPGNPYGLGQRGGFLPALGTKVWSSAESEPFDAYIYKRADGKAVGCIRIPAYAPEDADASVAAFAKIMAKFQTETDALVIDQLNNPGGSVFYLYALASLLTDQSISAPRHRIAITQNDVAEAAKLVESAQAAKSDQQAQALLGKTMSGYPVTYEFARHIVEFGRFIISEWGAGRALTSPIFLYGVDRINPYPGTRYTKPVLVLVNELDFSGGDFFPAILQDNKRAVLFGARTSGAGGFVRSVKFPNRLGIAQFSLTGSIAVRADRRPIENLGVQPDIPYAVTADDIRDGFKSYAAAADAAVGRLVGASPAAAKPSPAKRASRRAVAGGRTRSQ